MLSEHDRSVLRGMERALCADAPELAASFDTWHGKQRRGRLPACALGIAVVLLLAGLVLASAVLFWLGALAAGTLLGVRRLRHRSA